VCRKNDSDRILDHLFKLANGYGRGRGDEDRKRGIFPFDEAPNFVGCIGHFSDVSGPVQESTGGCGNVEPDQLRSELAVLLTKWVATGTPRLWTVGTLFR